jgi:hypothetical protein
MTYVKVTLKMLAEMYISSFISAHYTLPVLTKIGMCSQQISVEHPRIKFYEFSNCYMWTDDWADIPYLVGPFLQFLV